MNYNPELMDISEFDLHPIIWNVKTLRAYKSQFGMMLLRSTTMQQLIKPRAF